MSLEILAAVWDLDLARNEQDVLEVFAWHANADGICWPSKARIMYKTGLSESTVKRAVSALKTKEILVVKKHAEGGRGKVPIYKVQPEKGGSKPPFKEWQESLKGVRADDKGVQGEHEKGVIAVNPEPSVRTVKEEPSEKDFTNVPSFSGGEPQSAMDEKCEERNDEGGEASSKVNVPFARPDSVVAMERHIVDEIYTTMRSAGYRLPNEDFTFHLGRAKDMLAKDEPTDEEIESLPRAFVELFEIRGKADAASALTEIRRQRNREKRISESRRKSNLRVVPQTADREYDEKYRQNHIARRGFEDDFENEENPGLPVADPESIEPGERCFYRGEVHRKDDAGQVWCGRRKVV